MMCKLILDPKHLHRKPKNLKKFKLQEIILNDLLKFN